MNPFLNPFISIPSLQHFLFDPSRLQRKTSKDMERYRDKMFRRTIKYAYTVPLYHNKYREAGIHPGDITGVKDIAKLPFITKQDIIQHFPDDVYSVKYDKSKAFVTTTSGVTGKPVSLYTDFPTMAQASCIFIRELQQYHLHWNTSRIAHIGNFSKYKPDSVHHQGFISPAKSLLGLKNYLFINAFDPMNEIIEKLDRFQPDLIISYPATFGHLAYLKNKGYGSHINPTVLNVGASETDPYTKRYVEEAFHCKMLNVYSSTEAGSDIAFECFHGTWHINYDFYYIEVIDENREVLDPNTKGQLVLTRLFGHGTPFIRYTGMQDWVTIAPEYTCNCGLCTQIFPHGIGGRISSSIYLPDGRLFPAASFASIEYVVKELNTKKIKQYQIVQKKIDEIVIFLVIDEELHEPEPSVNVIIKKIQDLYAKKAGPEVTINVKTVKEIPSLPGKPAPVVISNVKPEKGYKLIDW